MKVELSNNIKQVLLQHFEEVKNKENFSNARYVRNIFEKIKIEQANRVIKESDNENLIKKCDIEKIISNDKVDETPKMRIGFAC